MSALAGPDLEERGVAARRPRAARATTFGMESVALKARERGSGEWIDVEHVGWAPPGEEAPLRFDVPIGPHLRLVGRGPALFAEDQRVLEAFAAAARTAYEGQRAERGGRGGARRWPPSTSSARRCSPRSATTCARRSPGSRRRSAACGRPTSSGRTTSATSCWATIEDSTRPARRGRRQPPRREPPPGRSAQRPARAGRARRGRRRRRCSRCPGAAERVVVDVPEDLPPVSADRGLLAAGAGQRPRQRPRATAASDEPVEIAPTPAPRAPSSRSSITAAGSTERAAEPAVRALPAPRRSRPRGRRARALGRPRLRRGDGRRDGRRRHARRRADDAHPPRSGRRPRDDGSPT